MGLRYLLTWGGCGGGWDLDDSLDGEDLCEDVGNGRKDEEPAQHHTQNTIVVTMSVEVGRRVVVAVRRNPPVTRVHDVEGERDDGRAGQPAEGDVAIAHGVGGNAIEGEPGVDCAVEGEEEGNRSE